MSTGIRFGGSDNWNEIRLSHIWLDDKSRNMNDEVRFREEMKVHGIRVNLELVKIFMYSQKCCTTGVTLVNSRNKHF